VLFCARFLKVSKNHLCFTQKYANVDAEGDVVLLKDKNDAVGEGILTTLRAGKTANSHRGVLSHSDIIGKQPRQIVRTKKGSAFRIHEPTLGQYVCLTPRIVTPVSANAF